MKPQQNILLVDDDPGTVRLMSRILADVASLRFATSGAEALTLMRESLPDLVLLDAEMPGMSGFQLCQALKADADLAEVPVIFVTSHAEPAFEVAGFEIGAADFIAKPVTAELVVARVRRQLRVKQMADELHRVASTDGLTGVANRRRFDEALAREWLRARRSADPIALLLLDVDQFKPFNDRYGHPAGDACLRAVAQAVVAAGVRPADLVARYGGEEFALLLPHTPRCGAEHLAHRVLDAVEALAIRHAASRIARHVTVSIGITCFDQASAGWTPTSGTRAGLAGAQRYSPDDLVKAADLALYAAKEAGRAQAWLLDVADVGRPSRAREIAASRRPCVGTAESATGPRVQP